MNRTLILTAVVALSLGISVLAEAQTAHNSVDGATMGFEEGVTRLERLLGSYDAMDAKQFRMPIDTEIENRPEPDKPPVHIISKGELIIGNINRSGETVSFDMIESIKRTVYELQDNEQKTVNRRQQRYLLTRYTLHRGDSGEWEFDSIMIAHSIPMLVGKPYSKGSVKWLSDGIQLTGISTDRAFAADGKLIPVAVFGKITMTQGDGDDELLIEDAWQCYQLGTEPGGLSLPFPDFMRPVGSSHPWLTGKATR